MLVKGSWLIPVLMLCGWMTGCDDELKRSATDAQGISDIELGDGSLLDGSRDQGGADSRPADAGLDSRVVRDAAADGATVDDSRATDAQTRDSHAGDTGRVDDARRDGTIDQTVIRPDRTVTDQSVTDQSVTDRAVTDQAVTPTGCGDGERKSPEQCDDGNQANLDGCDSTCRFEQLHRINSISFRWISGADECPVNSFGTAIASEALRNDLNSALSSDVGAARNQTLWQFIGMRNLEGTTAETFTIGALRADAVAGAGHEPWWDIDWWYTVEPEWIDAARKPLITFPAQVMAGGELRGGPGAVMPISDYRLASATFIAGIDYSGAPDHAPRISTTGAPPGHLASEHLDEFLGPFEIMGTREAEGAIGHLCGALTALSLSKIKVPTVITDGTIHCAEGYQASQHSLLDLLVSGCKTESTTAVSPIQPDRDDNMVGPAGAGPTYRLIADTQTHKVTGCQDKNNQAVDLQQCLTDAAFSAYLRFSSNRVVVKP